MKGKIYAQFLKMSLSGFLIFIIPPLIFLITTTPFQSYSTDLLNSIYPDLIYYGLLGVFLSLAFIPVKKFVPKYSKLAAWSVIVVYSLYWLIFIISSIYFKIVGPPIGPGA